ncbi:SigE family RNA polymerase sigma factor [Nocardioides jejuensis]|nr:SigE family RNA polymerase sigma factor [Nocardioides jejuensis]
MTKWGALMLDDPSSVPRQRDDDFSAYVEARRAALLRTAYLMTGDLATAEDVVQTTLAKLYLAWDKVSARDAVHSYTRRILTNEVTSLWRRAWRRRELPVDRLPDVATDPAYDDGTAAALWAFVGELAPRARAVVVLRYYEQLTEAEIAEVMGISVGTVKSQCSRALASLRARVPASLERPDTHERPARSGDGEQ